MESGHGRTSFLSSSHGCVRVVGLLDSGCGAVTLTRLCVEAVCAVKSESESSAAEAAGGDPGGESMAVMVQAVVSRWQHNHRVHTRESEINMKSLV